MSNQTAPIISPRWLAVSSVPILMVEGFTCCSPTPTAGACSSFAPPKRSASYFAVGEDAGAGFLYHYANVGDPRTASPNSTHSATGTPSPPMSAHAIYLDLLAVAGRDRHLLALGQTAIVRFGPQFLSAYHICYFRDRSLVRSAIGRSSGC